MKHINIVVLSALLGSSLALKLPKNLAEQFSATGMNRVQSEQDGTVSIEDGLYHFASNDGCEDLHFNLNTFEWFYSNQCE